MSDPSRAAYAAGLAMLSRRDLSEAQLRERLARKEHPREAVDEAITRLRATGALDDRRLARIAARTEAEVRVRGRARVFLRLQSLGIPPDIAEEALDELFGAVDEAGLLERAIERRLRPGTRLSDPSQFRRLFQQLVRQGFAPGAVIRALKARAKAATLPEDEISE